MLSGKRAGTGMLLCLPSDMSAQLRHTFREAKVSQQSPKRAASRSAATTSPIRNVAETSTAKDARAPPGGRARAAAKLAACPLMVEFGQCRPTFGRSRGQMFSRNCSELGRLRAQSRRVGPSLPRIWSDVDRYRPVSAPIRNRPKPSSMSLHRTTETRGHTQRQSPRGP